MRHLLSRIGFYLIAFWASITLNFIIPRLAPGNPAEILLARYQGRIQPQALNALEIQFGVSHDPLWIQYFQYLNNLLHGNLGLSFTDFPTPVTTVIAQELPWTLVLVSVALVISFCLGTLLGMFIAWRRGSFLDNLLPPLMTFVSSIPYFFLALMLLYLFGNILNWFPLHGGYDIDVTPDWSFDFISNAVYHAILPALSFILVSVSGWMIGMRNSMITTLSEDYALMAEAKGLRKSRILFAYAGRNAILPQITAFAISLGGVVAGQLLIEMVFSYPGVGFALLQAAQNSDYPLVQGIFLILTIAVLGANFLVDLIYAFLDPRIRQERS